MSKSVQIYNSESNIEVKIPVRHDTIKNFIEKLNKQEPNTAIYNANNRTYIFPLSKKDEIVSFFLDINLNVEDVKIGFLEVLKKIKFFPDLENNNILIHIEYSPNVK